VNVQQHLSEARAHLLAAAKEIEEYIQSPERDGWEVVTPVVAAAFGMDHASMAGAQRLLFELAVDTAVDHVDSVKAAVLKAKHHRKPSMSPSAAARARA
jgi:hypothetical protein